MFRSSIEKKLSSVTDELKAESEHVGRLDQQLLHVSNEAEDLRLRAIVSETPLASAEHREAVKSVAALRRDRERSITRIAELERKQDELLDRLVATNRTEG